MVAAFDHKRLCASRGTCRSLGERDVPVNRRLRKFDSVREANESDLLIRQVRDNQRVGFRVDASAVQYAVAGVSGPAGLAVIGVEHEDVCVTAPAADNDGCPEGMKPAIGARELA
jgi:hypothetical protein